MKFYFTYGTDSGYPFQRGWTEVRAKDFNDAVRAFRAYHMDRSPGVLNCADYYTEDEFAKSGMMETGNFGAFCHEVITLEREVKTN